MKPGDMVKVNFPTGKGGPYEYRGKVPPYSESIVRIDGIDSVVNTEWIEPAEPELEEGRLYYYWDNDDGGPNRRHSRAKYGNLLSKGWDHYEPVHRQWEELREEDKVRFKKRCEMFLNEEHIEWFRIVHLYKQAYKFVTGEECP